MSSSSECGRITNRTSICPKVLDVCPSSSRQLAAASLTSSRMRLTVALLFLALSPFSDIELNAQTPLESTVDASIKPGDDFYAYANGAWLKAAVIPAGKERWSVRDDINDRTRKEIAKLLEDASASSAGSLARKV